ncbi:MAG: Phosphoribosyl-AMP cyclohydrolase [Pseudidiomarina mangrovi]|nr:MAG: Phosphoribosyl-AMP cyclohydrolase [Pseudidiomarina mangrovi]
MKITATTLDQLAFAKSDGLLPAIVQHALTGVVLMQGYMNRAALEHTLSSQQVTFFSRSKQRLWTKGESSGHTLQLLSAHTDCDQDSLLLLATPLGPTCHSGCDSCFQFADDTTAAALLSRLEQTIAARKQAAPSSSYTAELFAAGTKRIAQKVGEEGVEVALAAVAGDNHELLNESADLLFHLLTLLASRDLQLSDALAVLAEREARAKAKVSQ